jgi:uncharacterized protein (DUF952 family)
MAAIYKILSRDTWRAALRAGIFTGSTVDLRDGFIHFSTAAQAQETAERHFRSQPDLVVLEVDADALGTALRWEPSRGGALFPHLYGPLPTHHVLNVFEAPLDAEGIPSLTFLNTVHHGRSG